MARDRILTDPEKIAASAAFKAAMLRCGKTQSVIAEETAKLLPDKEDSFSQGTVWQWANSRLAINAERAVAVATVVSAHPEVISVSYRQIAAQVRASQLQRLDSAMISKTIQRMRDTTETVEGQPVDVEADPALFAEMLRLALLEATEPGDPDGQRGVWKANRQSGGIDRDARSTEARPEADTSRSGKRKAAAKRSAKSGAA